MAGTYRRPVPNDRHPNSLGLPDHLYYALYFLARKDKRTTKAVLFRAIEELLAREGMIVGPDAKLLDHCPLCELKPLTKGNASKRLLKHGIWMCQYCDGMLEQQREEFIRKREAEARASGAPVPINRAITRTAGER